MAQELEYVVNGALMSCDQGTIPVPIIVTSNAMARAGGMPMATDADKVAMANIPPFGICRILTKSTPVPCVPALIQWQSTKSDINLNKCKPLMSNSCATCSVGGKVEFLMNGQIPLPPEIKKQVEEAKIATEEAFAEAEKEKNAVGEAGFAEGLIPLWGSGRDFIHHAQVGNYGMAALNLGLFAVDAVAVAAGIVSFGAATAVAMGAKAGVVAAIKAGGKVAAKSVIKKMAAAKATGLAAIQGIKKIAKEGVEKISTKVFNKGIVKTGGKATIKTMVKVADPGNPALREKLAREFYEKLGWPKHKIDNHIKGIDFTKPVEIVEIQPGTKLSQWQAPGKRKGEYFTEKGTPPSKVGTSPNARIENNELVKKIETEYVFDKPNDALKSTAAPITDRWSENIKGPKSSNSFEIVKPVDTEGGGVQYFIPK
jgi:hypothetical protein